MSTNELSTDARNEASASPWRRRLSVLVAIAALAVIGSSLALVVGASRLPWADEWHFLFPEDYLAHPFRQHNEHRLAFPSLVFALDAWVFHGTHVFDRFVVVAMGLAHALLLAGLGAGPDVRTSRFRLAFAACATAMLSAIAWHDLVWGFAVQLVAVFFFASCAIASVTALAPSIASTCLACACIVLAAFSMGNGVLVGPYVLVVAGLLSRPKAHLGAIAAVSLATLTFYFHDYHSPDPNTSLSAALTAPFAVVAYALRVLGAPLVRPLGAYRAIPGLVAGGVGIFLWLRAWVRLGTAARRDGNVPPAAAFALPTIAGFAALSALAMAVGRVHFPPLHAFSSRYGIVGLVFWSALALEALRRAGDAREEAVATRWIAGFVALLAIAQPFAFRGGWKHVRETREAETALLAGANDARALGHVNFTHEVTLNALPTLRARRLSIFHDAWAGWLGDPMNRHLAPLPRASCGGHVDAPVGVLSIGDPAYRISGRVPRHLDGASVTRLVVVDESKRIVGYAQAAPSIASTRSFTGHVGPKARPGGLVSVHALVGDGRSCRIGSPVRLPPPRPSLVLASSLGPPLQMTLRERRGFASPGVPVGEPSPLPAAETFGSFGAEEAESQLAWHGCAGPDVRFVALPLQVSRHASAVSVRVRSDDGSTLFELDDPSDFRRWALVRLVLPDSAEGRCFTIEAGEHDPDGRAFIAVGTPHIVR